MRSYVVAHIPVWAKGAPCRELNVSQRGMEERDGRPGRKNHDQTPFPETIPRIASAPRGFGSQARREETRPRVHSNLKLGSKGCSGADWQGREVPKCMLMQWLFSDECGEAGRRSVV